MVKINVFDQKLNILVFLTGEEEIEDACKKIDKEVKQIDTQERS